MLLNMLENGPYDLIIGVLCEGWGLDDKCLWNLSSMLVWNLNYSTVGHCGVGKKMGLELGGCDLMA